MVAIKNGLEKFFSYFFPPNWRDQVVTALDFGGGSISIPISEEEGK